MYAVFLYVLIVLLLAVLVKWEYKRATRRRTKPIIFEEWK